MTDINNEPEVSVGILTEEKLVFELHGDFTAYGLKQTFSGRFLAESLNDRIVCHKGNERIEISDEIIFIPRDPSTESFLLRDVTIGKSFHWQRKEKQRFTGSLKLLRSGNKIAAINILPVEDYLVSVISSEMSARSSLQLLKSHAIISRSWLFARREKSGNREKTQEEYSDNSKNENEIIKWYGHEDHELFDVCADDHCQRYQGITKIFTESARTAVKQTEGVVLVEDNKICDTRYSKACGGITESFENVWEPEIHTYLKSVIDYKFEPDNFSLNFSNELNAIKWIKSSPPSYCNTHDKKILSHILMEYDQETTDFYRWKVEYYQKDLEKIIRIKTGIDFGDILDLVPVQRGHSARLIKLKIIGTKRTLIIGKELEIRRILSKSHLYSSAIVIEKENIKEGIPQKFIIYGAGWGHGVGLCQIGAAVMASKGFQFDEILLHYFTNARLKKIY